MDKVISNKIEDLRGIAKKFDLVLLLLFGSRVGNNFREDSDYDFVYFSRKKLKKSSEKKLLLELEKIVNYKKIDLIDLKTNDSFILRNEIFKNSFCIYESKTGVFEDLASDSWMEYIDNLEYIESYKKHIISSIKNL